MFSNKNGCERIKKIVKMLMEFFQKFSILTENLVDFDVTCSVILGTDRNSIFSWENPNIVKIQIGTKKVCQIKA